jgi:PAS domain S-box-containing protein
MIAESDIINANILIVDDLEANVLLLEQILRNAGYTTISSTRDARCVCDLHRRNRYDLILLDLQMPGMDGFQVMKDLKAIETSGYLPVLVITAQPEQKLRALKAGAKDFIGKPFDLAEVLARVHNMIEVRLLHLNESVASRIRLENSQRITGIGDWEYSFPDHRLLWSEEVYTILGIAREDFPPNAETFYGQVHPDDLAFVHREKAAAATGQRRVEFEHRILRHSGEVRYIHQVAETLLDANGSPVHEFGTIHDITDRKLSEDALRKSEERYRKLLMLSPDATFVLVDGIISLVNPAFCKMMGATEPSQLMGRTGLSIAHPDSLGVILDRRQKHSGEEPIPTTEMKLIRLNGTEVDVDVASVGFDFFGSKEIQVIARDITARKRAEEELKGKTALLEAQIDSSIDGILIVDTEGTKIVQNHRFLELIKIRQDYSDKNADEKTFQQVESLVLHPGSFAEKVLYLYAHPHEASRDEIELKDGTVLDRYSSPILSKDGKNYGRIWAFRDITANKAAEAALRQSEERFKFVARAVSDVVWDWDLTLNTLWWNDGFLTTFGFEPGEIVPSVESWTARIHPEERARVVDSMRTAIAGTVESWSSEYRFQRKDGSYASVQDRGYILRDESGKGVRMVGGMRDLTEQKKMEAQQLRAQRVESIGTLAGGIAHDLNNVLAPIMMSIELLQIDSADDPRRSKILDTIYVSCRRGADLVRQVLSFALGLDGQRVAIRLRPLFDDLRGIITETFPRNIRIVSNVPQDLWPMMGDPTQLHQVLLNLAVNARDAMPHGGTLTLSAANTTIDAQFAATSQEAKEGQYVLLQVTDTGLGIPPEVRARIFEPFFTTKEVGKGTGIGLATVFTVVRSHGGFIAVESEVGRGSSFKVYLPAEPAHKTAESVNPFKVALPRGRGELVLVVDDEFSIRDITKQTLEAFGYHVLTASDGAEAVALYAKHVHEIAVVLTDMMMPVLDGPATIQVLMRINPAVKIIAASGINSGDSKAKSIRAGVKYFLLKPYTAETLLRLFRDVLDSKTLPRGADSAGFSAVPFATGRKTLLAADSRDHAVR